MRLAKCAPRGAAVTLVALVAAIGVAACGSSSSTSSKKTSATTTTSSDAAGTGEAAFTACLKEHGVTLPKRAAGGFRRGTTTDAAPPTGTTTNGAAGTGTTRRGFGGGFFGGRTGTRGFAAGNSKDAKAFKDCESKLGTKFAHGGFARGGFGGTGATTTTGHFTPHYSKATLDSFVACIRKNGYAAMPDPNTTGKGSVFPSSVAKNAEFEAASKKCASILTPVARPPAAGQTTTSTTSTSSTTSST